MTSRSKFARDEVALDNKTPASKSCNVYFEFTLNVRKYLNF